MDMFSGFSPLVENPQKLLQKLPGEELAQIMNSLKRMYDYMKKYELYGGDVRNTVPELYVNGFDLEQVWQQIELQNREAYQQLSKLLSAASAAAQDDRNRCVIDGEPNEESGDDEDDEEMETEEIKKSLRKSRGVAEDGTDDDDDAEMLADEDLDDEDDDQGENEEEAVEGENDEHEDGAKKERSRTNGQLQPSVVDDRFFKLADMASFLDEQDKLFESSDAQVADEDYDYFRASDESDDGKGYKYAEFFDPPTTSRKFGKQKTERRVHFAVDNDDAEDVADTGDSDEEDDEESTAPKSSFEQRNERLRERMADVEQENLAAKPWQMAGEVTARDRPENSLLEEYLIFDRVTRPAPFITPATTQNLEDIIKQRIKDKAWDDVQRKMKPKSKPNTYENALKLDQQKSELSLGEVYEKEFLKQYQNEEEKRNPQHEQIEKHMKELFHKLDLLCSYHYVPQSVVPEVKVINNMKSVTAEDIAPTCYSEASLLTPEEIKPKTPAGQLKAPEEKTKTEKLRERKRMKMARKLHSKSPEATKTDAQDKSKKGKGKNPPEKKKRNKASSDDVEAFSSSAFFRKLDETIKRDSAKKQQKSKPLRS